MYASLLRISGALHLGIFDQPERNQSFKGLLTLKFSNNNNRSGCQGVFVLALPRFFSFPAKGSWANEANHGINWVEGEEELRVI
jgi:hypothetical protein